MGHVSCKKPGKWPSQGIFLCISGVTEFFLRTPTPVHTDGEIDLKVKALASLG